LIQESAGFDHHCYLDGGEKLPGIESLEKRVRVNEGKKVRVLSVRVNHRKDRTQPSALLHHKCGTIVISTHIDCKGFDNELRSGS